MYAQWRKAAALAAAAAMVPLGGALAQAAAPNPKAAAFFSAGDIAAKGARELGRGSTYFYAEYVRDGSGEIEVHDDYNDVVVVEAGQATMITGDSVTGNRVVAPGEHRGGIMTGEKSQAMAPGDVMFIPAGMPHRMILAPGAPRFRYLVVKTKP